MALGKRALKQEFNSFRKHLELGDKIPDFSSETTLGKISSFYEWAGDNWVVLCSHPADFTPVCTSEVALMSNLTEEFDKRNTKILSVSCSSLEDHLLWTSDIQKLAGRDGDLSFPIVEDQDRTLSFGLGIMDPDMKDDKGVSYSSRATFIIDPQKNIRLIHQYPSFTGRNYWEIIRILDSLLLIESHPLATPVNWKFGSETFVLPWITEQEKRTHFDDVRHEQLPTGKDYVQYGSPKLTEEEQEILHTSKIAENVKSVDGLSTPIQSRKNSQIYMRQTRTRLSHSKGEIEPPAGIKETLQGGFEAIYTPEQQARLKVDQHGFKVVYESNKQMELPKGLQDRGTYTAAVYTIEQQKRLKVTAEGKPLPTRTPQTLKTQTLSL
eukprot:m.149798 g.149798  ORF g.149798 m.149798 type:complete len:381 (+) comp15019_c2_seq3:269-1411(+)